MFALVSLGAVAANPVIQQLPELRSDTTFKNGQIQIVRPHTFIVTFGELIGGELRSLFNSDDDYVIVRERPSISVLAPSIEVVVIATSPIESPKTFGFVLEASCSGFPTLQRLSLYNYESDSWELVDERNPTSWDSIVEFAAGENPSRFVKPGTKEMKARIGYIDSGVVSLGWVSKLDWTVWGIG